MHAPNHPQAMNRRVSGGQTQAPSTLPGADFNALFGNPGVPGLGSADIERHQPTSNGPNPDEAYYNVGMMQGFPVPGARQARRGTGDATAAAQLAMPPHQQQQPQQQQQQPNMSPHMRGQGMPGMQPATLSMRRTSSTGTLPPEDDTVRPFLDGLAAAVADPSQRVMWTELIRLKTKALELQIADARAKERAAELELLKLQRGVRTVNASAAQHAQQGQHHQQHHHPQQQHAQQPQKAQQPQQQQPTHLSPVMQATAAYTQQSPTPQYGTYPLVTQRSPAVETTMAPSFGETLTGIQMPPPMQQTSSQGGHQAQQPQQPTAPQHQLQQPQFPTNTTITPFDLEAILQGAGNSNSLDHLFSWLPDNGAAGAGGNGNDGSGLPQTAAPGDLIVGGGNGADIAMSMPGLSDDPTPKTPASPGVKRPHSPESDGSPAAPAPKKGKGRGEKKIVIEQQACCIKCSKTVARVLVRAPRSAIPEPINVEFMCPECSGVHQPPTFDPHSTMGSGPSIGSTETRKRMRAAMEDDDLLNEDASRRRCFCDVCQRVVATGQVVGGPERQPLGQMSEIVCANCDAKYQRCTDCGGGGGPRVGIGKWRLKQVFQVGRKTCSLSHNRLGDRPREIGVHVTPSDFTPEQLKEVIARCKQLWTEKTLSRLAVPEMLEIDLPPHVTNPLRNYADVEDLVHRCWPSREAMIRAEGADPARFKRLLGLTWAHARSRRNVRTVDIEEQYAHDNTEDDDMSTVIANVKRTNAVIPPGSELIGMWGGEWDMQHGSLLVSTLIPFEGTDGEDHTALSVGELITKVQQLQQEMNERATAEATMKGAEPTLVRPCEHLWVVSGGSMPLIRERMADILVRKRSFVHVEEYLTRHPDFVYALKERPAGLHPEQHRPMPHQLEQDQKYEPPQPLILVRWLGKDFDAQRIREIKEMEFGGGKGKKLKKMPKSKV